MAVLSRQSGFVFLLAHPVRVHAAEDDAADCIALPVALLIFPVPALVALARAAVYGLLTGILTEVVVDVLGLLGAFNVASRERLPLLPLLVHAVLETLAEVLGDAASLRG